MALNIINKLKNVDLSKTTETFSEVKTSFSNMFDKKKCDMLLCKCDITGITLSLKNEIR